MTTAPTEAPAAGPILAVEGVDVSYGARPVLQGVGFSVAAGEFTGLIGTNGAGKTTLFRVILGLQKPQSGQVRLSRPVAGRGSAAVGYVPQKVVLDPDTPLRARDLVGLGVDGHRFGWRRRDPTTKAAVEEMLAAVGAERFADQRVGRLSGGQQQRVLIAAALVGRPQLLILDEPLANLDLASGQEIVALLARICRAYGVAVLLSAHEINPLLPVMDRVVYLAAGHAASGTTREVIRPEVLSRLYGYPVQVLDVEGRVIVLAGGGAHG